LEEEACFEILSGDAELGPEQYYSSIFPEELKRITKTSVMISGLRNEVWDWGFLNPFQSNFSANRILPSS
jgi:hypothetical protein